MAASATCQWMTQEKALAAFANFQGKTESAEHIKPLHWYVACRLVLEGGFRPEQVKPHPPFRIGRKRHGLLTLHYDESLAGSGERTLLGGLKTKNVDVVVTHEAIGPVLAVSCKGVSGAFRNLTNRMEELIGECTNLHISMPMLVLGYLVILRANKSVDDVLEAAVEEAEEVEDQLGADEYESILTANDIAISAGGEPVEGIIRFHNALSEITHRRGIRNDFSRYEAIGLGLTDMEPTHRGKLLTPYPPSGSKVRFDDFFSTLLTQYDERFVVSAPTLAKAKNGTRRLEWSPESPALTQLSPDYSPRVGSPKVGLSAVKQS